jgi:hypothetical protein
MSAGGAGRLPGVGDPLLEPGVVAGAGGQQGGEGPDQAGQGGHLGAGRGEPGERLGLPGLEVVRPGEHDPGGPAVRQMGPACVQAALVDVADEQVGAAGVAPLADLPQQLRDRDAGLFGRRLRR